ncbi:MAG: hypothetical protein JWN14_883 [Chthonomonadales bacterium]|nr:hypothetical protein [Chthonomonadales bacterium]
MSDQNDPQRYQVGNEGKPPPTRLVALGFAVGAGVCLVLNHYEAMNSGKIYMWILFIAPMIFFLGVGGLIDPRILWSIGQHGRHFPTRIKLVGGMLAIAGLIVSAYLALGVYRMQDLGTSRPSESREAPGSSP